MLLHRRREDLHRKAIYTRARLVSSKTYSRLHKAIPYTEGYSLHSSCVCTRSVGYSLHSSCEAHTQQRIDVCTAHMQ